MFESYYGLSADPFRLSPDHRFSYLHPSYKKAQAYMTYALGLAEGFVMVTGRPGTGKTTLIGDLLGGLDDQSVTVARLATTQLQGEHFLRAVAYAFGLDAQGLDQATVLRDIEQFLIALRNKNRSALLVIDEAQDLQPSALTELRLLANMQLGSRLLMQAFLIGQEHLVDVVRGPGMDQFRQRIIAACNLSPLDLVQTRGYIEHRLKCAGWQGLPGIEGDAIRQIYQHSQGIPRQINLVCSRLLLHGFVENLTRLGREDARSVIAELHKEQLSPIVTTDLPNFSPGVGARHAGDAFASRSRESDRANGDASKPPARPWQSNQSGASSERFPVGGRSKVGAKTKTVSSNAALRAVRYPSLNAESNLTIDPHEIQAPGIEETPALPPLGDIKALDGSSKDDEALAAVDVARLHLIEVSEGSPDIPMLTETAMPATQDLSAPTLADVEPESADDLEEPKLSPESRDPKPEAESPASVDEQAQEPVPVLAANSFELPVDIPANPPMNGPAEQLNPAEQNQHRRSNALGLGALVVIGVLVAGYGIRAGYFDVWVDRFFVKWF